MILRSAPPSPFGRKVKLAAACLGLSDRLEIENADTLDENDSLRTQNPLGKIPALILDNGDVLYDSRVIVEYLDHLDGKHRLIPEGISRFPVLTNQSLADGIMDAALLQVYEKRWRDEGARHQGWLDHHGAKVERGLRFFENHLPALSPAPRIDAIALACALGYLDLRFEGTWRKNHPALEIWLEDFAKAVPAFAHG